jgi:Type I restriction enzyme R protein N terminus (HSDR_N)
MGLIMLEDFDFTALNDPGYKEDAVREDIIAPILRKAGYQPTGTQRMERSKPLVHPFVMIGSKKRRINIIPDYTLYDGALALMVLEAKAPNEPIVLSEHVEQAFSYAIHQDIRCRHYALCNGRQLAFYDVGTLSPLLLINCQEVSARWEEVEKYLRPRFLKMPELREFAPDFGLQALKLGVAHDEEIMFEGYLLQLIARSRESLYTSIATCNLGGLECMISFDFGDDVLKAILAALPMPQAVQVRSQLFGYPYAIDTDAKVRVTWTARLGEQVKGPHEEFVPLIVTAIGKVEYDPTLSVGPEDPAAVNDGVQRLRV